MGFTCSKSLEADLTSVDCELEELRCCLALLLKQLSPEELLNFAVEDTDIHELCKNHPDLRQSCILAAIRRYHAEKFIYENVYNRTADYMVLLDNFIQIQDVEDMREPEEEGSEGTDDEQVPLTGCFPFRKSSRHGDGNRRDDDDGASTSGASSSSGTTCSTASAFRA